MGFWARLLNKLFSLNIAEYKEYLFNNPHMAIAILNTDFNFLAVNELFAKQNNLRPEDFPGKNLFQLYPDPQTEAIFRQVVTTGQCYHTFARPFQNFLKPEEPVTYCDWSLVPLKDRKGRCKALILHLVNVTQRIKKIRESEERFQKVFNLCPVMMTIRDLETGRFISVNDAWSQTVGYSQEEACGKTIQDLNISLDRDPLDLIRREGKRLTNIDAKFNTRNGQIREVLYSSEIIEIEGKPHLLTASVDITQRKNIETELARLDRLNLIGQMAAGIGHEIRNPITTIRGFLQILSMKEKYAEDRGYFQLMISEVDRANSIITEFLSLSKTRSENLSITNLNNIIEAIYPLLQAKALQSEKEVQYNLGKIPDSCVCEKEIRQVVLNMVTNCLEASPRGGTVWVQTKQENEHILLIIKDSGPGIEPHILQRLGTPFLTTKPHGTGLGLAICYNIVERHGGDIQVETGPGGTTFTIRFPLTWCGCDESGAANQPHPKLYSQAAIQ